MSTQERPAADMGNSYLTRLSLRDRMPGGFLPGVLPQSIAQDLNQVLAHVRWQASGNGNVGI